MARTVAFVGKFKLDWVFVKPPALTEPYDEEGPHRFGRTLKTLNDAVTERVSDHSPLTVDLPLGEPRIVRGERRRAGGVTNKFEEE
ncbi:MAG TPA: hypothetical protein VF297_26425 [Pyrinomonadaceae bacterium]